MAPFRFPAGASLGSVAPGGRFASGAQIRSARYGGASLTSRFPGIIAGLGIRCHAAAHETAEAILERARELAPYRTGALKGSLYLAELDITEDWMVASDLEYAPYQEFGTINHPPQPYIVPAVEAERGEFIGRTTAALQGL
jgi:hypothetical protein